MIIAPMHGEKRKMTDLKAADIMTPHVIVATPEMKIIAAAKLMNKYRIGGLPVVRNNKLVGILTERCIMKKVIGKNKLSSKITVKQVMSTRPLTTGTPDEGVSSIASKMKKDDVSRVPILNNDKLIGMVTNKDVIENAREHIDIVMEQAQIEPFRRGSVAFGRCEVCGGVGDLALRKNQFMCDGCYGKTGKAFSFMRKLKL